MAGATGDTGSRIVRELLEAGFFVRAGVRNADAAQSEGNLAVAMSKLEDGQRARLRLVPFDLTDTASLRPAIGAAKKVGQRSGAWNG